MRFSAHGFLLQPQMRTDLHRSEKMNGGSAYAELQRDKLRGWNGYFEDKTFNLAWTSSWVPRFLIDPASSVFHLCKSVAEI
jgi:hypothetical protein